MNGLLETRWSRLWLSTELSGDGRMVFDDLVRRYGESGRHYHNLAHITECLREFDTVRQLVFDPASVELAIWFHDAIYDSHANDNEQRSGDLAERWLAGGNAPPEMIASVKALIFATRHEVVAGELDSKWIVDIDLAILGQDELRFKRYEAGIRREYSWVPEELFLKKRLEILERFMARERIYQTDFFFTRYERQARTNLEWSIRELRIRCVEGRH